MIHLWTSPFIKDPGFYHHDMLKQLSRTLGAKPRIDYVEGIGGVHVFMVLSSWLFKHQGWFRSLRGPKVLIEHDAYLNFMPESPHYRAWNSLYRNSKFDLLLSSGKGTTERLLGEGIPAAWVPKGTNSGFLDTPSVAGGIGYFSCPIAEQDAGRSFYFYKSRHDMGKAVKDILTPIACSFADFPTVVSRLSAVVTDDRTMREPMAKHFECSALGTAVIRDLQPELYDLGYVEGESVISYADPLELPDLVVRWLARPEELAKIGSNAREVARGHTWTHRAKQVSDHVALLSNRRIHG